MKLKTRELIRGAAVLLVALAGIGTPLSAQSPSPPTEKAFVVAHAMKYPDRPDLSGFGVPASKVIYESALVTKDKESPLPAEKLQALAATLTAGPLPMVLDIETWPLRGDKAERERNAPRLIKVIDTLRQARPDLKFGFYGEVPERTYFPLVNPKSGDSDKLREWEAGNEMALTDIVPHVERLNR